MHVRRLWFPLRRAVKHARKSIVKRGLCKFAVFGRLLLQTYCALFSESRRIVLHLKGRPYRRTAVLHWSRIVVLKTASVETDDRNRKTHLTQNNAQTK